MRSQAFSAAAKATQKKIITTEECILGLGGQLNNGYSFDLSDDLYRSTLLSRMNFVGLLLAFGSMWQTGL